MRRPSNGRMGTSAPTQGHDRFRRGRCPQRPVNNGCTSVVPLIRHGLAPMPPSPLRGEGFGLYFRRCSNVDGVPLIRHGCAVPPSPRGRHCAGEFSLPHPRGPIPLVKGKCPEGTKGIGKVAPKGPDEGDPRGCIRPYESHVTCRFSNTLRNIKIEFNDTD